MRWCSVNLAVIGRNVGARLALALLAASIAYDLGGLAFPSESQIIIARK
jgi:hypothetical protein